MPQKLTEQIRNIISEKYPILGATRTVWHLNKAGYKATVLSVKSYAFRNGIKVQRKAVVKEIRKQKLCPVGHISMKRGDLHIKVSMPNVWEVYRRWYYRQFVGEIKKGYLVIPKDGDKGNITPENLISVPKAYMLKTEKALEALRVRWEQKREATERRKRRHRLVKKYGSISNALAMGEKL
jgi:hypothetical protein